MASTSWVFHYTQGITPSERLDRPIQLPICPVHFLQALHELLLSPSAIT